QLFSNVVDNFRGRLDAYLIAHDFFLLFRLGLLPQQFLPPLESPGCESNACSANCQTYKRICMIRMK
ncbi:hypothetical protein L4Q08_006320, partial [Pseudomonas aeruginosa]